MKMKKSLLSIAFLSMAILLTGQDKDNTLSPEEFAEGWELLFDGESLKGWKAYNGAEPKTWKVEEGAIYCDGTKGGDDLMTVESFGDFDLKFEWKIPEDGNSGVIYLTREGKQWSQPYLTGLEYQVFGEKENFSNTSVGSIFDVYAPSTAKKLNPPMEWNSGRIRVSEGTVTHWVNGKVVLQCQLHSEDWNARVDASKWKKHVYYGKSPFGHIDFQNHGHEVWYKNVKINQL
jgi:hypothetical protein